jgi:hypothetical protein
MLSPSQLQTLLNQFQSRYPMGCLCAELLTVHQEQYVVRALVQLAGTTLATAMAAAPEIEAAEDRAKIRALEALGFGSGVSSTFAHPAPSSLLGNLALETGQPQKSGSSNSTQPSSSSPQLEEPNPLKAKATSPLEQSFSKEPKLTEKPISVAQPLGSVNQLTSPSSERATDPIAHLSPAEVPPSTTPAISSSIHPIATATESNFAEADFTGVDFAKTDFAANEEVEVSAEPKTAVGTTRAPKAEKLSKRKTEAFELPPMPAPSSNPSDRSEEIMKIGIEMKRLGWSTEQGREYLKRTYGKRSRQELDDAELLDFLHYLEGQPSPLQTPF